ncbi:MAG TPA: hypothetical protein VNI61_07745 [Gemmatimonadales bacterium]|nr:hypothetical protein [Gemmatimonadales bacterium]
MRALPIRLPCCGAVLVSALLAACDDPFALPPAGIENVVDTVSLWAASGTPLHLPSAYLIEFRQTIRTDQSANFDFAFDLDPAGRAVLSPTGALRLGRGSGIRVSEEPFDSITVAPGSGYQDTLAVVVDTGTVAVVRSRPVTCTFAGLAVFYYAKLRVLAVDSAARRLDFEILANANCGYRSLEPGFPRQ